MAQREKNLPVMQETLVRSLDWEDPLEKQIAVHCSILAWRIPWIEGPGRLQSKGSQRATNRHTGPNNTSGIRQRRTTVSKESLDSEGDAKPSKEKWCNQHIV